MPFHFLHSFNLPFFGSLMKWPYFQSFGISSTFHVFLNSSYNLFICVSASALSDSRGLISGPCAFLLFSFGCNLLWPTSSFDNLSALISSVFEGYGYGGFKRAGRFRSSSACSVHLLSGSLGFVSWWLSFFFTGCFT